MVEVLNSLQLVKKWWILCVFMKIECYYRTNHSVITNKRVNVRWWYHETENMGNGEKGGVPKPTARILRTARGIVRPLRDHSLSRPTGHCSTLLIRLPPRVPLSLSLTLPALPVPRKAQNSPVKELLIWSFCDLLSTDHFKDNNTCPYLTNKTFCGFLTTLIILLLIISYVAFFFEKLRNAYSLGGMITLYGSIDQFLTPNLLKVGCGHAYSFCLI